MINLSTFDASLRSRLLGWCCSLVLILGLTPMAFAQPTCTVGSGNTLTGPSGPPNLTVNFDAGCSVVVPNVIPRWTPTPGPGYVLITIDQAPLAGTPYTAPKSGTCANEDVNVLVTALFFFIGNILDPSDDILCSLIRTDVVLLRDNTPPTVTPPGITLDVGPGCTVTAPQIIATLNGTNVDDNCTTDAFLLSTATVISSLPPALTCPTSPQGPFGVTIRVTDACGNTGTGIQSVTLRDLTIPTITCPPQQTQYWDANCSSVLLDYRSLASATDVCGGPSFTFSQRSVGPLAPVNTFPNYVPGGAICPSTRLATVRICAQDCFGNGFLDPAPPALPANCCNFGVLLLDTTRPVATILCPGPQFIAAGPNCTVIIPDLRFAGLFTDNCDPINPAAIVQTPPPGPFNASGLVCPNAITINVSFSYTDCNGNGPVVKNCGGIITVGDITPPSGTVVCPPGVTYLNLDVDPVTCQYTTATLPSNFFNGLATVADNCDPNPEIFTVCNNPPGIPCYTYNCYFLGPDLVELGARDCAGNVNPNIGTCEFFVRANPADANWTNPGRICLNTGQLPLNLCTLITGVTCGEWSGDQVSPGRCNAGGGIFNPTQPGA